MLSSFACTSEPAGLMTADDMANPDESEQVEVPLGDFDGKKSDSSTWGAATTCKPIPVVDSLVDPAITISLDGLTLHLVDLAGSYDRVFPIGPGVFENGVSLTPTSEGRPHGTTGICTARCSTNDDCALGTTCEAESRFGTTTPIRSVCLPY